ncbi:MAG TPA: hypothetical protein VFI31_08085 [Pirellulales bacterium]|nr:hypothetical protein [Pirellulales bacterium]
MSRKFEIDQLEERIAPSTMALGGFTAGASGSDGATISLPILGTVSVGANANDSASFSGVSATLPSLPGLPGLPALPSLPDII